MERSVEADFEVDDFIEVERKFSRLIFIRLEERNGGPTISC